jgi:hypothetical protein
VEWQVVAAVVQEELQALVPLLRVSLIAYSLINYTLQSTPI